MRERGIDGQQVVLASASGADLEEASGTATLTAGTHAVEVVYFEANGASGLELLWTPPNSVQQVVPPQSMQSSALPGWTAGTGSDGRFTLRIPAALDGVEVQVVSGTVVLDR